MKNHPQFFLILPIILAALISGCESKQTAQTSGLVTKVSLDRNTKTTKTDTGQTKKKTKTSYETEINYSYMVKQKPYSGYAEKNGNLQSSFSLGSAVTVCYNPAKPEDSDVYRLGSKCPRYKFGFSK